MRFYDIFNGSDVRVENPQNDSQVFGLNCPGSTGAIFSESAWYEMCLGEDND